MRSRVEGVVVPKNVVFTYTVSQSGPTNIEQRHRIYRSGNDVRDETLAVDGLALTHKVVRISRREDRYAVARLAPRIDGYQMLFLRAIGSGSHLEYVYDVTPLLRQSSTFVDRVTIDGLTISAARHALSYRRQRSARHRRSGVRPVRRVLDAGRRDRRRQHRRQAGTRAHYVGRVSFPRRPAPLNVSGAATAAAAVARNAR